MINRRKILLSPEIGDWTVYKPQVSSQEVKIGSVGISKFDRLSKEDLVFSHRFHYTGFERLCAFLMEVLKMKTELYAVDALQLTYEKFFEHVPKDVVQVSVFIDDVPFFIYCKKSLAYTLLERMLGGKGKASDGQVTLLEHSLFEKVASYIIKPFWLFWGVNDARQVRIKEVVNGIKIDQSISPKSAYIYFSGKFMLGDNPPGEILLGYSRESLQEMIRRARIYEQKHKSKIIQLDKKTKELITSRVEVEIGSMEIPMRDVMTLAEGDVIKLNTKLNSFLKGNIGNKVFFSCFPGFHKGKTSIQIMHMAGRAEEIFTDSVHEEAPASPQLPAVQAYVPPRPVAAVVPVQAREEVVEVEEVPFVEIEEDQNTSLTEEPLEATIEEEIVDPSVQEIDIEDAEELEDTVDDVVEEPAEEEAVAEADEEEDDDDDDDDFSWDDDLDEDFLKA